MPHTSSRSRRALQQSKLSWMLSIYLQGLVFCLMDSFGEHRSGSPLSSVPHSPCDTSLQRSSLWLELFTLLLRYSLSSTTTSATKLDVAPSSSSSSDPEELHTSITTQLSPTCPPSITQMLSHHCSAWHRSAGLSVQETESRSREWVWEWEWVCTPAFQSAGQTSCLVVIYNPSGCKGHLSSHVPPFTWSHQTIG